MFTDDEIISDFVFESDENLMKLEFNLIEIEKGGEPKVDALFRAVHSIKSAAAFLELKELEALTHSAETSLSYIRDFDRKLSAIDVGILIKTTGIAQDILDCFKESKEFSSAETSSVLEELKAMERRLNPEGKEGVTQQGIFFEPEILNKRSLLTASPKLLSPEPSLSEPTFLESFEDDSEQESLEGDIFSEIKISEMKSFSARKGSIKIEAPEKLNRREADYVDLSDSKVKVSTSLLDEIINLVGELVVARNQIVRQVEEEGLDTIKPMLLPIARLTTDIQERVMKTRMRQIGSAWNRYPRMVRDLAREINKKVNLVMVGQDTELDRGLLTMLQEPMRHMLRNSIDHGLETPEERIFLGKPSEGTVSLKAYQASGQVIIELSDDGRGLDAEKIKNRAISKGLLTLYQAESMTEEELRKLIFSPGFSTKEVVTKLSGRGVGLDIVQELIAKVTGMIEIESIVGEGTTFRIHLPLTLAILSALIVSSNGSYFAIAQDNLLEVIDIQANSDKLSDLAGATVYHFRGDLLPLITLRELTTGQKPDKMTGFILVVIVNNNKFGLVVDEFLDTEEIVVKPLGEELQGLKIFSGVTIHGNGKIAWIIDVASVVTEVNFNFSKREKELEKTDTKEKGRSFIRFEIEEIGSLAVDISNVVQIEKTSTDKISRHGRRYVYSFNGKVLPVFTFGISEFERKKCHLIILESAQGMLALWADRVHEMCHETVDVSNFGESWSEGLMLLSNIPTSLVNIDELLERGL